MDSPGFFGALAGSAQSAVKLTPTLTTADAARRILPRRAKQFFRSGRVAFRSGDPVSLHAFRVDAKRFRYALELFAPLYGTEFHRKLNQLKKLQELLGSLNDLVTAHAVVGSLSGVIPLAGHLDAREREIRASLEAYWTETLDAPGNAKRWVRYLRQYAASKAAMAGSTARTRPG